MEHFNNSIGVDKALWAADLLGSDRYAKALERCGVIDAAQAPSAPASLLF